MRSMVQPGSQAEEVGRLILAGFIVLALPALPFGNYLVYPFTILTTWFHEMGHGLTALCRKSGGHRRLAIFARSDCSWRPARTNICGCRSDRGERA